MEPQRQLSSMMDISVPDTDIDVAVAAAVAAADLLENKAKLGNTIMKHESPSMMDMVSVPGGDAPSPPPMDISLSADGCDQQADAVSDLNSDGNGAVTNNIAVQSPLKSVEEETGVAPAVPLIGEHQHSLSNQSGDTNDEDAVDDHDIEMSPSKSSLIGPCRSIEEASVNTTIESVAMEECVVDASQSQDDAMPTASSYATDTTTYTSSQSHNHNIKLCLTPEEERLFDLLTNAAEAYEADQLTIDPNPPQQSVSARGGFTKQESALVDGAAPWLKPPPKVERIEIRVAGGWVRDKLLNQHSVDVDVALDCMMVYLALQDKEKEEGIFKVGWDTNEEIDWHRTTAAATAMRVA